MEKYICFFNLLGETTEIKPNNICFYENNLANTKHLRKFAFPLFSLYKII